MKIINFITNQDINTTSGGWSGINVNIFHELSNYLKVNYIGPINPRMNPIEKLESKMLRTIGLQGNFSFFSEKRLNIISERINSQVKKADYNFFFGQTPWINYNSNVPYGVYMDADFKTYLDIYSTSEKFRIKDIKMICKKEEKWLNGASDIFVGSQWAWDRMMENYDLDVSKKTIVHTGGNVEIPLVDSFGGGLNFLFISLNFEKKGGFVCVKAFSEIQKAYPQATLTIIGQKPPPEILTKAGIVYAGLLRKTVPEELVKFKQILSNTFLLIHPTEMDTMGAVLIEAGYFGCPSIAPRRFGIPELIIENKTGMLLEIPFEAKDIASKIHELIENNDLYSQMRIDVRKDTVSRLSWSAIGIILKDKIKNHLVS